MTERVCLVEQLLAECDDAERRMVLAHLRKTVPIHPLEIAWGTTAEVVLESSSRAPDITQRGVRGVIAEAVFETEVLPELVGQGWQAEPIKGQQPYDFLLSSAGRSLRIQVKLQRRKSGIPMPYPRGSRRDLPLGSGREFFTVEVQRTRTGTGGDGADTRPYRFGDFDLLAVSLHPSTGSWHSYLFTVGAWLLPRSTRPHLTEKLQPVPAHADAYWTENVLEAVRWWGTSAPKTLYTT